MKKKTILNLMIMLLVGISMCFGFGITLTVKADEPRDFYQKTYSTKKGSAYDYFIENYQENYKNIEKYLEESYGYKLIGSSYATEEKEVMLETVDYNVHTGGVNSFTINGNWKNYGIKFKTIKEDKEQCYFITELRGVVVNTIYWDTSSNPQVGFQLLDGDVRFSFSINGLSNNGLGETTQKFAVNTNDQMQFGVGCCELADGGFFMFMEVENLTNNATAYAEAVYKNVNLDINPSGFTKFYNAPYNKIFDANNSVNYIQNFPILGIEEPVLKNYSFKSRLADYNKVGDISEFVPMNKEGITYTYNKEYKSDSPYRSLFNTKIKENNYSFATMMKIEGSETFTLDFSLKTNTAWSEGGIIISLKNNSVKIAGENISDPDDTGKVDFNFEFGKEYKLEIFIQDFYLPEQVIASGAHVGIKIDDNLVKDSYILYSSMDKTKQGNYLSGYIAGTKGNSFTFYPINYKKIENKIEIDSTKIHIDIDKIARLRTNREIENYFDKITYKIVAGDKYATIEEDGLKGLKDGTVKVKAVVENEFGTFESDTIEIKVGSGVASSSNGCKSSISLDIIGTMIIASIFVMCIKKGEKYEK